MGANDIGESTATAITSGETAPLIFTIEPNSTQVATDEIEGKRERFLYIVQSANEMGPEFSDKALTANAVMKHLREGAERPDKNTLLVDIKTGSSISVLEGVSDMRAMIVGRSGTELDAARQDAEGRGVDHRMSFIESEGLKDIPFETMLGKRMIVSVDGSGDLDLSALFEQLDMIAPEAFYIKFPSALEARKIGNAVFGYEVAEMQDASEGAVLVKYTVRQDG